MRYPLCAWLTAEIFSFQNYHLFIFGVCLRKSDLVHWSSTNLSNSSWVYFALPIVQYYLFDSNLQFFILRTISLLGLLFIAIGTGGIKPCVSSFGGEQFVMPHQVIQLQQYFSLFYVSINAGSTFSTIITPILRNDVKCFGQDSCFSLAFGVPAIFMCSSLGKLSSTDCTTDN